MLADAAYGAEANFRLRISELGLQPRKKLALNVAPARCYLLKRHVPSDSIGGSGRNTMTDSDADASIYPLPDEKSDALLLFCKWLRSL